MATSLLIATALCVAKLVSGTEWVCALGTLLVGHGTQDVINRIKK